MKGLRWFSGIAVVVMVSAVGVASPAPQSGYTFTIPGTSPAVVCTGGDLSRPSIGAWSRQLDPSAYTSLDAEDRLVMEHLYDGTSCAVRSTWAVPITSLEARSASFPLDTRYTEVNGHVTTVPFGSCPPHPKLGTPEYPGCISAYVDLLIVHRPGWFTYTATDAMEADIYLKNDVVSWTPLGTNFKNNHGESWGMSISGYKFNYGTHIGYGTVAKGKGEYIWGNPKFWDQTRNFFSEVVHVGYKARATQNYKGSTVSQDACFFGDFRAWNGDALNGGWCAVP